MPKKQFRRKRASSDSEGDDTESIGNGKDDISEVLQSARELQKIRKRQKGVNAVALATGAKITNLDEMTMDKDPFKLKTGGLVHMRSIKDRNRDRTYEDTDRDVTNLGSTFSMETNRRDEDAELTAYIENELKRIKGQSSQTVDENSEKTKTAEDKLYQLPEHLQIKVNTQSEEMLSNQMLSGIPEIDLGLETKIKNIERTEEAKQKLIQDMTQKREKTTSFVPINMAVNYVQHKRYMNNNSDPSHDQPRKKKEPQQVELPPLVVGDTERRPPVDSSKARVDKSTDNFHYEKFRKNVRR